MGINYGASPYVYEINKSNDVILLEQDQKTHCRSDFAVGIVAMECYTPGYAISADILENSGIPARTKNGQKAVCVWENATGKAYQRPNNNWPY